jgi:hypothetical protein
MGSNQGLFLQSTFNFEPTLYQLHFSILRAMK